MRKIIFSMFMGISLLSFSLRVNGSETAYQRLSSNVGGPNQQKMAESDLLASLNNELEQTYRQATGKTKTQMKNFLRYIDPSACSDCDSCCFGRAPEPRFNRAAWNIMNYYNLWHPTGSALPRDDYYDHVLLFGNARLTDHAKAELISSLADRGPVKELEAQLTKLKPDLTKLPERSWDRPYAPLVRAVTLKCYDPDYDAPSRQAKCALLLKHGARLDETNENGDTPLIAGVHDALVTEQILKAMREKNQMQLLTAENRQGNTALIYWANSAWARSGYERSENHPNEKSLDLLLQAARESNLMRRMLDHQNKIGATVLHYKISMPMQYKLLHAGANINIKDQNKLSFKDLSEMESEKGLGLRAIIALVQQEKAKKQLEEHKEASGS